MRRSKPRFADPGEISSGTLRPEDLIPTFCSEALALRLSKEDRAKVLSIEREAQEASDSENDDWWGEDASECLTELEEILSTYAPPLCYFGSHEGDGASFGFWFSDESLREAVDSGEVWDASNRKDGERCPKSCAYYVVISDHGNVSLYYRNGKEVWGIV